MKLDQALREQEKMKNAIYGIYRTTCEYHETFEYYLERHKSLVYHAGLPYHVKEYLRGYRDGLFHIIQLEKTYWGYLYEGVVYEGWDNLPDEAKELIKAEKLTGNHFWKDYISGLKTSFPWN